MSEPMNRAQRHEKSGYFTASGFRSLQNLPQINDALCLVRCGEEQCAPGHAYQRRHTEHHLHFVLQGKGFLRVDGAEYALSAGDIFFTPAEWDMQYQADLVQPWHYAWVAFRGRLSWELLEQAGFSHQCFFRHSARDMEEYHSMILQMLDARATSVEDELLRLSLLYRLFSLLVQEGGGMRMQLRTDNPHIHRAIALIEAELSTMTVQTLSERLALNRSYLSELFRQELGCSPQDFLRNYRMKQAALWLTTSDMHLQDIAAALGYQESYNFTKAFRSVYGISPSAYRKKERP